MVTSQKMSLFGFFVLKMVDLKMVTTHFDSLFRRLLINTTETNYIARENILLWCRPSEHFSPIRQPSSGKDPPKTQRELADVLFWSQIWLEMDRQQRTSGSLAHLDCRSDDHKKFHTFIHLFVMFCYRWYSATNKGVFHTQYHHLFHYPLIDPPSPPSVTISSPGLPGPPLPHKSGIPVMFLWWREKISSKRGKEKSGIHCNWSLLYWIKWHMIHRVMFRFAGVYARGRR